MNPRLCLCCPTGILQLLGSTAVPVEARPEGSEPRMPKAAAYLLIWRQERETYELRESQSNQLLPLAPSSQEWFAWLAAVPSFTFRGQAGQLTVRREARPRGGTYWYGSRRVGEHMVKRYLGRTADLTPARLEEVAAQVARSAGEATLAPAAPAQVPAQHAIPSPSVPPSLAVAAREAV